jgi:hypothetical protein
MGVLHGLNESGQLISAQRREYLRRQSDRHYVCNRNRQPAAQNGGKIESIDPVMQTNEKDLEFKLFQQMMCDYENAYNRVRQRKLKKTTLPACTETLQWSKY